VIAEAELAHLLTAIESPGPTRATRYVGDRVAFAARQHVIANILAAGALGTALATVSSIRMFTGPWSAAAVR
jgi:hypothetical protein